MTYPPHDNETIWGICMRYVGKIATIAALVFVIATPALAGMATVSPSEELQEGGVSAELRSSCDEEARLYQGVHVARLILLAGLLATRPRFGGVFSFCFHAACTLHRQRDKKRRDQRGTRRWG